MQDSASIIERFVNSTDSVYKGPWLDIKLPFASESTAKVRQFRHVKMQWAPYAHQLKAYERLSTTSDNPGSTIIATGTGSGKTECFSYPMFDHCLDRIQPHINQDGIKAIVIYPMNALATDQARRFAREAHQYNKNISNRSGRSLRIGLYTGDGTEPVRHMSEESVITDRNTLRDHPPDILLTNYKMLDYLLMRPQDQMLWRNNTPGVLRYLIVDELHTFDGAQGTDLACLIRRLRARLSAGDELLCVGTSATIGGGDGSIDSLRRYASTIFSTEMDEESIIGESRLSREEYIQKYAHSSREDLGGHEFYNYPFDKIRRLRMQDMSKERLMEEIVEAWFPSSPPDDLSQPTLEKLRFAGVSEAESSLARVKLAHRLRRHRAFKELLEQCEGLRDMRELAARLIEIHDSDGNPYTLDDAILLLDSLVSMIAWARDEAAAPIYAHADVEGSAGPTAETLHTVPMLHIRAQLWMRELRRMVATTENNPVLRHDDDLANRREKLHLPLIHCRECLAMGWGTVRGESGDPIERNIQKFYQQWFAQGSDVQVIYPLVQGQVAPTNVKGQERYLCSECGEMPLTNAHPCCGSEEEPADLVRVWLPYMVTSQNDESPVVKPNCPWCRETSSLSIVGSQAASLASVSIAQLFGSNHTEDRKLITFSDSVQDAAHRAGFFGARTYRQVTRLAMAEVALHTPDVHTLTDFAMQSGSYWRKRLGDADFVGTFIAPNMEWLGEYNQLLRDNKLSPDSKLAEWVEKRMQWDAFTELGAISRIGRTIERTRIATVAIDEKLLGDVAFALQAELREHVEGVRNLTEIEFAGFLRGMLTHWRHAGAFDLPEMRDLVRLRGNTYPWTRAGGQFGYLPGYGNYSLPPKPIVFEQQHRREMKHAEVLTTTATQSSLWSAEWFRRTIVRDQVLMDAAHAQIMRAVVNQLMKHDILRAAEDSLNPNIFLMNPDAWILHRDLSEVACDACQRQQIVPTQDVDAWRTTRCLRASCSGHFVPSQAENTTDNTADNTAKNTADTATNATHVDGANGTTAAVNAHNERQVPTPTRVVAEEHTGLLEADDRKKIEEAFIDAKHVWDVNLLSSTPTLEMGIDIGDLSSVLLCSVPPSQANYLQRIGRAGRRDGNALTMVFANAISHDNYFYADPMEMMDGDIQTPGVFLQALAVLERQLTAYAFDSWARTLKREDISKAIPLKMQTVLNALKRGDKRAFPYPVLNYINENKERLIEEFLELFEGLGEEGETHLREFLIGENENASLRWRVLDRLQRVLNARENFTEDIQGAKREEDKWKNKPDDDRKKEMLLDLEDQILSYTELRRSINQRQTLNFFTDEGLLPNYAFPEEGVTLDSVIVKATGAQSKAGEDGKARTNYERYTMSFQRSASAALSELAPESRFYAAAHQLTIERVDLKLSSVEKWRLCDSCDHAELVVDSASERRTCPRCQSEVWSDVGQLHNLIRLRQVYAYAHGRNDRIDDRQDNRHTTFYERQLLVDIPIDLEGRKAWEIDDPEYPFGFEYLPIANFRELNFGTPSAKGQSFRVAGKESTRPGFKICKHCGIVHQARQRKQRHQYPCPIAEDPRNETDDDWFQSLYLYRELTSESLRILLPVAESIGSDIAKESFVAALQLGLRTHFKGDVQHLEITTTSVDGGAGDGRREYVLIYDKVPGGTGYLKDLMRTPDELMEAFQSALNALQACPTCSIDEARDGCYKCILAYRSARSLRAISRKRAIELLRELLKRKDKIKETQSIDHIVVSGLLESRFEAKVLEHLSATNGVQLVPAEIDGKSAYRLHCNDLRWALIPQVDARSDDRRITVTRSDFNLRLERGLDAKDKRRFNIHIFADGYEYHQASVADDVSKRQHLLARGKRVWTLVWADLPDESSAKGNTDLSLLLADRKLPENQLFELPALELSRGKRFDIEGFLRQGSFQWLVRLLKDPLGTEAMLQAAARAQIVGRTHLTNRQRPEDLAQWVSPDVFEWTEAKTLLYGGAINSLIQDNAFANHLDVSKDDAAKLITMLRPEDLNKETWHHDATAALWIDDIEIKENTSSQHTWEAFWAASNVMQFAPNFAFATRSTLQEGTADHMWPRWPERELPVGHLDEALDRAHQEDDDAAWEMIFDPTIGALIDDQMLRTLVDKLRKEKIGIPEIGEDLMDGIRTAGMSELMWKEQKLAVFSRKEDAPTLAGWTIIHTEAEGWIDAVMSHLSKGN